MQSIFSAGSKKFGPAQNILRPVKGQGISISASSKTFVLTQNVCDWAQYVNKFLVRYKKCGPTQNILGPVKGLGISK